MMQEPEDDEGHTKEAPLQGKPVSSRTTPQASVGTSEGSVLTFRAAFNALHSVYPNWNQLTEMVFRLGLTLCIPHYRLRIGWMEPSIHPSQPLAEMLEYWVIKGTQILPTWNNLIKALEDADQGRLAHELQEKDFGAGEQTATRRKELDFFPPTSPTVTTSTVLLSESDLDEVLEGVSKVRDRWYILGLQLGLTPSLLRTIHYRRDHLREILVLWLQHKRKEPPTWSRLADALRSPMIGEDLLADRLEEKDYATLSDPSPQTSSNLLISPSPRKETDLLSESDLVEVFEEVFYVCDRWYDIGLKLGLTPGLLDTIREIKRFPHDSLREVLREWLQQKEAPPTWSRLVGALRTPLIGHFILADELEEKHWSATLPRDPDSTPPTSSIPSSRRGTDLLSELDLVEVHEDLLEAGPKWYDIGLKLGLTPRLLDAIRANNPDSMDCMREMLWQWLQQKKHPPTWHCLIDALNSRLVGLRVLAHKLVEIHLAGAVAQKGDALEYSDLEFTRRVGIGGFGTVWKGKWKSKNMIVAIKKVDVHPEREREIKVLSTLDHPSVIRYYGTVEQSASYFIVTEFAENGSIYDYIHKKRNQPSLDQGLQWLKQVAQGMVCLHEKDIIHRDLKSSNVVLTSTLDAKIVDLGCARTLDHPTKQSTIVGTYAWMAPEMIRRESVSKSCDVYSYGIVLWEIVTQRVPFSDVKEYKIPDKIATGEHPTIPDNCESRLADLMSCCWKDPEARPSFEDILKELNGPFTD